MFKTSGFFNIIVIRSKLRSILDKISSTIIFATFYIVGVISFFMSNTILFGAILLTILILLLGKNIISNRQAIVFYLAFALAFFNCHFQIKNFDDLSSFVPTNATITGTVLSIPTTNNSEKTKFYLKADSIKIGKDEHKKLQAKTLVTIYDIGENSPQIKIADKLELTGKLRAPFSAKNPSQFDYRSYLKNHKTYSVFYVTKNDWKIISKPKKNSAKFLQKLNDKRTKILDLHKNYVKSPNIEVLGGIIFGDDAINPPIEIKNSFINSGLLHILAASGMNVSIIFGIWFFIGTRLRLNYRFIILAGILLVAFYTLMTGMGASVLRAALMIEFVLLGKLFDRSANSIALLFLVALLMLIYNPAMINDIGFQLSFIVTFALIFYCPPILENTKNRFQNCIIGAMLVPFVAQLFAAPIQMFYFNTFATYSIFANFAITPFIMVISFLGFVSSIFAMIPLGAFNEKICLVFTSILNPFVSGLINISNWFANLPNSLLTTVHPSLWKLVLYYLLLIILGLCIRQKFSSKKLTSSLLILFVLFAFSFIKFTPPNCEILVFDVGNADSFLIKTPQNKYIMIDTAHGRFENKNNFSQAESILGQYLKDYGIKSLDLLILTHFDTDHSGGAIDILKMIDVKKIVLSKDKDNSKTTKLLFSYLNENNIIPQIAQNKETIFEENDLKVITYTADFTNTDNNNDNSIITLLSYGDFDMLFMADAGIKSFNKIQQDLPNTKIEILKSAHHGAHNTITNSMINTLNPDYAVISTGSNSYGHPAHSTLHTLAKNNVKILRTDVDNAIKIVANKKNYKIKVYNPSKKTFVKL